MRVCLYVRFLRPHRFKHGCDPLGRFFRTGGTRRRVLQGILVQGRRAFREVLRSLVRPLSEAGPRLGGVGSVLQGELACAHHQGVCVYKVSCMIFGNCLHDL